MLQCVFLLGTLFVSDGQIMIDLSAVTRAERSGDLMLIGTGGREDGLDVSAYPDETSVHAIFAECAARADQDVTVTRLSADFGG